MQTQTRTSRAPDHLWDAVVTAAEQTGVNTSEILRRATASYGPVRLAADGQSPREGAVQPQEARY